MRSPLSYMISTPGSIEEGKKYPVIYVFHGIGSDEEDIFSLVDSLKDEFILISIRGFHDREDGYSHYEIEGFGRPVRESFDQCVDRLLSTIEYCAQTYPIDRQFQYALGFSQGAALAMTIGLMLGNQIKGVIALSGYLPSFLRDHPAIEGADEVSIYISHGVYDPLYPLREAKENERFFLERGNHTRFVSYLSRHEVTVENQQDFIKWLYEDLNKGRDR